MLSGRIYGAAALTAASLVAAAGAQTLPMTRAGLDSALAQYFAGADRNGDGKLDRNEAAAALGVARSTFAGARDAEPFALDMGSDGRPRLLINEKGPLGRAGLADSLFRHVDRNGDATLSLAEVQAAGRERFDAVDADRDGILDERERRAAERQFRLLAQLLGAGGAG